MRVVLSVPTSALLDQVVKELGHLLVEAWIRQALANDRLADVVDDALGD